MLGAVYSTGMLWVGGLEGKEGGLESRPTSSGKEGGQGHIWHISGPFQSGSRCIPLLGDLAEQQDEQWLREEKKGEHHALLPISLVMLLMEDGVAYTYLALVEQKLKQKFHLMLPIHRHRCVTPPPSL